MVSRHLLRLMLMKNNFFMKKLIYFCLLNLLVINLAYANDSAGTTAAGGILFTKTPFIAMQREDLTIDPKNIHVSYLFKNNGKANVITRVFFPLPPFKMSGANAVWDSEVGATTDAPFINFSVTADGKPVKYETITRALIDHEDVTEKLQQAGIPLNPDLVAGRFPLMQAQEAQRKQWLAAAQKLGLLDDTGKPRWRKQITFSWLQAFPVNQVTKIEHQYRPAAGSFYMPAEPNKNKTETLQMNAERMQSIFNLDFNSLVNADRFNKWLAAQIDKDSNNSGIYAFFYNVDYILTTGANWDGPIKDFNLTINNPAGTVVAYNAFYQNTPIKLNASSTQTKIHINNYIDLLILKDFLY